MSWDYCSNAIGLGATQQSQHGAVTSLNGSCGTGPTSSVDYLHAESVHDLRSTHVGRLLARFASALGCNWKTFRSGQFFPRRPEGSLQKGVGHIITGRVWVAASNGAVSLVVKGHSNPSSMKESHWFRRMC